MVSALSRHNLSEQSAPIGLIRDLLVDSIVSAQERVEKTISFPYALREFVNSIADLPTIEELTAKSESLARVMHMAS